MKGQTTDGAGLPAPIPSRFSRPSIESDEGGLWSMMDREEARLRRSPFLVREEPLTRYIQTLVCRLGGDHCSDVRAHVVRTPIFNANMAPNGMMQVWTGLLLRMENEAQLAAVIGHELGHYLERHSVEQLRAAKDRAAFAQFLGLFGAAGALGQIGVLASGFAFSRDHETRADRLGMRLMRQAGYDGAQAAQVWDNLLTELKVTGGDDVGKRSPMMATHPPVATRRDDLIRLAGGVSGVTGHDEYLSAIRPYRLLWLRDEIKRGQYDESIVLFDRMLTRVGTDPEVLFARGEVFRLRGGHDDLPRALQDLQAAGSIDHAPADVHRSLGLIYKHMGRADDGIRALERYLVLSPQAPDAELVKHYIQELKS